MCISSVATCAPAPAPGLPEASWGSQADGLSPSAKRQRQCDQADSEHSSGSSGLDLSSVSGLEDGLRVSLQKLSVQGVQLSDEPHAPCYTLRYGGEVPHDGNCLFQAAAVAMGGRETPQQIRRRVCARFLADARDGRLPPDTDSTIRHLYSPDVSLGWGVHLMQEVKLLLKKEDEAAAADGIANYLAAGLDWAPAAETVYRELGTPVADSAAWASYMACDGAPDAEEKVVTLQYVEDGLLNVEVGAGGAFGDDLALVALATEYQRDVYVVQAHGSDADSGADGALFFLPHHARPLQAATSSSPAPLAAQSHSGAPLHSGGCAAHVAAASGAAAVQAQCGAGMAQAAPLFLLMKGSGWCGAGGDHYEPLLAQLRPADGVAPAFVL